MIIKYIILVKLVIKTMDRTPCKFELKCTRFLSGHRCPFEHKHTPEETKRALVAYLEELKEKEEIQCLQSLVKAQHALHPKPVVPQDPLYKTEECENWVKDGTCRFGYKCKFAHGKKELRPKEPVPPCKFDQAHPGSCRFGDRCKFPHGQPPVAGYRPREAAREKLGELTLG